MSGMATRIPFTPDPLKIQRIEVNQLWWLKPRKLLRSCAPTRAMSCSECSVLDRLSWDGRFTNRATPAASRRSRKETAG